MKPSSSGLSSATISRFPPKPPVVSTTALAFTVTLLSPETASTPTAAPFASVIIDLASVSVRISIPSLLQFSSRSGTI